MSTFHAQEYEANQSELSGWPVRIVTYRLAQRYICKVDNVSPGALIARAVAATKEEAKQKAISTATDRLARTRRFSVESA